MFSAFGLFFLPIILLFYVVSVVDSNDEDRLLKPGSQLIKSEESSKCEHGWFYYNISNACFKKYSERLNWTEAAEKCDCHISGSKLAAFHSEAEFDFIANLNDETPASGFYSGEAYWVGLAMSEGKPGSLFGVANGFPLVFVDGFSPYFFNAPSIHYRHYWVDSNEHGLEPKNIGTMRNGTARCIHVFRPNSTLGTRYSSKMADEECNLKYRYVCRVDLVDETTTKTSDSPSTTTSTHPTMSTTAGGVSRITPSTGPSATTTTTWSTPSPSSDVPCLEQKDAKTFPALTTMAEAEQICQKEEPNYKLVTFCAGSR